MRQQTTSSGSSTVSDETQHYRPLPPQSSSENGSRPSAQRGRTTPATFFSWSASRKARPHPALRRDVQQVRRWLRVLGPGIITGAADDDPSGIGTYSQAGAAFGFSQLWLALYMLPMMIAVQEMCADWFGHWPGDSCCRPVALQPPTAYQRSVSCRCRQYPQYRR